MSDLFYGPTKQDLRTREKAAVEQREKIVKEKARIILDEVKQLDPFVYITDKRIREIESVIRALFRLDISAECLLYKMDEWLVVLSPLANVIVKSFPSVQLINPLGYAQSGDCLQYVAIAKRKELV